MKSRKNTTPFKTSIIPHVFVDAWVTDALLPTADLMCRKKQILSTPDRTCHQPLRSHEFLVTRSSLAVSTALYSHPIQLFFWLRGSDDLSQNIRRIGSLVHFLKTMLLKSHTQQKRSSLEYHRSVPNGPPTKQRAPPSQKRAAAWTS